MLPSTFFSCAEASSRAFISTETVAASAIVFYRLGLGTREKALQHIQTLLDNRAADAEGFIASLLPADVAAREVRGPGCE